MQRRRLLTATAELAYEGGVQALSVAILCGRAGISRRTFYDVFDDREECVHAAIEDGLRQATFAIATALDGRESRPKAHDWNGRVRVGLAGLLGFLDREPGVARLLVVEALGSGFHTLELRKRALAQAAAIVDEGRAEAKSGREPPPLTAEGIVGAVFSVIHARMIERSGTGEQRPLSELTRSLMALIVHPYLGSAASQRELAMTNPTIEPILARRLPADPFKDLPIRLTYRTALVLSSIAQAPGASSRQVADASGITDPGQISRLLTRLRTNGLIQDSGIGPSKGMPRAWTLTERGENILQATGQA
jgi:AcrR family transcriptional regulator